MSAPSVEALLATWSALHDVFTLSKARALKSLDALEYAFQRRYATTVPPGAQMALRIGQARAQLDGGQWWACASILVTECDRLWAALAGYNPTAAPAPVPAPIAAATARERAREAFLARTREEFEVRRGRDSDALIRGRSPDHWFTFAVQRRGIDGREPPHWIAVSRRTGSVEHLGPDVRFQPE